MKKEHITDLKLNRETTTLAKKNLLIKLQIETLQIEKIANYENMHNALLHEAIEIHTSKTKLCNDTTNALIDSRWMILRRILRMEKILREGKKEGKKEKRRESADL